MQAHRKQPGFVAEVDLFSVEAQRLDIHARIEAEHQIGFRPGGRAQRHVDLYSQNLAGLDDDAAGDVLHVRARWPAEGAVSGRPVLARGQIIRG